MLVKLDQSEDNLLIPRQGPPKEMISVTQENGKTKVRINSSSLSIIQECKRKAQLSLFEGWKSENESPATLFGSAVHKAMEIFYKSPPSERKMPKFEDMEMMSFGHTLPHENENLILRATRGFIEKAKPLAALPENDKRSIQNGTWIMYHYFKDFIDDPYVAYIDSHGPFVEREFTFRLHEDDFIIIDYFGTIDLIVQHMQSRELLVTDHKTSSVVGSEFYNRLKPNHQYTGYLLGAQKAFGIQTNQFLVNCVQVKAKPVTTRGSNPHFPRQVTTRDADDFREFKDAVVTAVRDYLTMQIEKTWPIGQVNACATYGGCQYLSICQAPKSLRDSIIKAKFVRS